MVGYHLPVIDILRSSLRRMLCKHQVDGIPTVGVHDTGAIGHSTITYRCHNCGGKIICSVTP